MTLYQKQAFGVNGKRTFLSGVTGNQVIEEQDRIDSSPNMCVVATTFTPWYSTKKEGEQEVRIYDVIIYYEVGREKKQAEEEPENYGPEEDHEEFQF